MYKKYPIFLALFLLTNGALQADEAVVAPSLDGRLSACAVGTQALASPRALSLQMLYQHNDFRSLWDQESRQEALKKAIGHLTDDGLTPSNYQPLATNSSSFCQDAALSEGYLQALYDLRYGAVERKNIQPLWQEQPTNIAARWHMIREQAKRHLDHPEKAFEAIRPRSTQYLGLRSAYQTLKGAAHDNLRKIPEGELLKPGMSDARLPALAARLEAQGYGPFNAANTYDVQLVSAVKAFQRDQGLQADGVLGPRSLSLLNQSSADKLAQVRVNLERWRWLEHEQADEQLLVDIAGAELIYQKDGQVLWQGRTQVGRLKRRTPEIQSYLTRVTLNPTWTIPPTIMREDKLPKIRQDVGYLARNNMRVIDRDGNAVSPSSVNWSNPGAYMVRQQPGPGNPLGRMVLRFNNPYSIYLHDTPSQHLFSRSPRDFSSGCVRVEGIAALLQMLMSDAEFAKAQQVLATQRTQNLTITRHIPILLAYWTAQVNTQGQLQLRPDIYQLDKALAEALDHPKK